MYICFQFNTHQEVDVNGRDVFCLQFSMGAAESFTFIEWNPFLLKSSTTEVMFAKCFEDENHYII